MAQVTIYSTPSCTYCHMAKDFFKAKNVAFTEIDVAADQSKAEEMVEKSGHMGVPVILVKGDDGKEEVLVGFDKYKLSQLLGIS